MADESKHYSYQAITTLEQGLAVMLDLLTSYLGNNANRAEWITEIQKRFTRNKKLRRGWSDDTIDRKIHKLEKMGLIAKGPGRSAYYSAVNADDQMSASVRKPSANENAGAFLDVLNAARLQLL
jgi:hypothetical protein